MHTDSKVPTFQTNLYPEDESNRFFWNVMHLPTQHCVTAQQTVSITKLLRCGTEGFCLKQEIRHECYISFYDNYVYRFLNMSTCAGRTMTLPLSGDIVGVFGTGIWWMENQKNHSSNDIFIIYEPVVYRLSILLYVKYLYIFH